MSNDILEFIGHEHHNELVSIANLKAEIGFLQELDEIYREINNVFLVNVNNNKHFIVSTMFLQTHNEFYISFSQLLKSHLGKSFISLRIAIDAAFNGYYFTQNPKHIKEFLDKKSVLHKKIFWRLKDHITKNIGKYPLASPLIKVHEVTSNFSAHSSLQSIIYKYRHEKNVQTKKEEIALNYFDTLSIDDFFAYYFSLLKGYFMIFQLYYNCFYKSELKIIVPGREKRIADFDKKLSLKARQYPFKKSKKTPAADDS